MTNRDAITTVTDLLCDLVSPREKVRPPARAKWLLILNNPLLVPLTHLAAGHGQLDQEDERILGAGWDTFARSHSLLAKDLQDHLPAHWSLPTRDRDGVDLERMAGNLRAHVATAVAAHWAKQASVTASTDTEAAIHAGKQLQTWLGRASGLKTQAEATIQWTSGMGAADLVARAVQGLGAAAPWNDLVRAYAWTCFWLKSLQPQRSRTIPNVTVETESCRPLTERNPADLHAIDLGLLPLPEPLAGLAGRAVVEDPVQWNQPLGAEFVRTVGEAHDYTWRDQERTPPLWWRLRINDRLIGSPLTGASHGLALHVGCEVVRRNKVLDGDIIFSARVVSGRLATVNGLVDKRSAADRNSEGKLRRFGYWQGDAGQFHTDTQDSRRHSRARRG